MLVDKIENMFKETDVSDDTNEHVPILNYEFRPT